MTSQPRKSQSSLEVDGSQMGKLRPREKAICACLGFSLLTPGPAPWEDQVCSPE